MTSKIQLLLFIFTISFICSCRKNERIVKEEIYIDHSLTRDEAAYQLNYPIFQKSLYKKGIDIDNLELYIRAFKFDEKLEVWVKEKSDDKFQLFKSYDFCKTSGKLGPKRKEGDYQIPEGLYHISVYNPSSNFHLSLGINYPNDSDKILSDLHTPGNHIYIHGGCMTIGCIPLTDTYIKELYTLASISNKRGQEHVPVHIFPFKMNQQNTSLFKNKYPIHTSFWSSLEPFYSSFEKNKSIAEYNILDNGLYSIH